MSQNPSAVPVPSLTPHLASRDAAQAVEFYQKAFGAEVLALHKGPDGRVMHAALRVNGGILYLADECPEYGCPGPATLGGSPVTLHLQVADCDAVFNRAVEAGCTVQMPLTEMFWGDRYGVLTDPYGHKWSVATTVRQVTPEEIQKAVESFCAPQG